TSLLLATRLAAQDTLPPAARRALDDLRYLAADAREGRGVGTRGLDDAGRYLANAFRSIGLAPGGTARSYNQTFTIAADAPAALRTGAGGKTIRNVIGVLRGRSRAGRGQAVIVGAHYDHLGLGGFGALDDPDSTGRVHNGADDNASGVAALLEVARRLAGRRLERPVVFIAFSGEELGALGSDYYVKHPTVPVDSITAMLNLDMVGRLRNAKLIVTGAATAQEFPALLDSLNRPAGGEPRFDLRASGDGWGPSDQASFYAAKRPVLHFFTDLHADYHRSTDDVEKINVVGLDQVADFVADVAAALADRPGSLTFVSAPPPQASTGGAGYGAYLGTVPDMSESPGGVRITGTRTGSPAEQAGLTTGDIITAIGTKTVANLYDMTDALRSHQPGDTVVIVVKRDTTELRLTAVLGRRGS
ncbi:MAG: M20/M25/M40 family metallo-hydrolase, partial [Gemmatimonadales bacterium]